jgi:hypothetical protein
MKTHGAKLVAFLVATALIAACSAVPEVIEPPCSNPAPLSGRYHRSTPGYLVAVAKSVTNIESLAHELSGKYEFEPGSIMNRVKMFSVETLAPEALASLRCEPTIRHISFNEPTRIAHDAL